MNWKQLSVISIFLLGCGGGAEQYLDVVEPQFYSAPIFVSEPDESEQVFTYNLPVELSKVNMKNLTDEEISQYENRRKHILSNTGAKNYSSVLPLIYTPLQIRHAYGFPDVQKDLTIPENRAVLGAGETIYIISAYNHPNLSRDLASFNRKFTVLPCQDMRVTSLEISTANFNDGCRLAIVNINSSGQFTTNVPAYVEKWAKEVTLDVQWAHAMAPLARIIVIQAPDNSVNSMSKAITVANKMGPGIVSMSFSAKENTFVNNYRNLFNTPGMLYIAAAGDNGHEALWPSSDPNVIAVGGTKLSSYVRRTGMRWESAWEKSGGGYSDYFDLPTWQTGVGLEKNKRTTADISFNADPLSGQYVAFSIPGSTTRWYSMGGTSIGTPQWAGVLTTVNAKRKLGNYPRLESIHGGLYGAAGPGDWGIFKDIVDGKNGDCGLCVAKPGYDIPTGWGTPNVSMMLKVLAP